MRSDYGTDVTCGSIFSLPLQENVKRAREFVGAGIKMCLCFIYLGTLKINYLRQRPMGSENP